VWLLPSRNNVVVMKYKIGEELHRCIISDETGRPEYDLFRVRSFRGGKVTVILVNQFTWVKLEWGKNQARGWAKRIDCLFYQQCRLGEKFGYLHRTKAAALKQAREWHEAMMLRRCQYIG